MSEADFRRDFVFLTRGLDAHPIENLLKAGIPDVNLVTGWVELKWLREWPARATTIVRLDHYTDTQRQWLLTRWQAGGGAWLVLRCRQEWFCWTAPAAQRVGFLTRTELEMCATHHVDKKPTPDQLCSWFHR